jgi:hypothetical protein
MSKIIPKDVDYFTAAVTAYFYQCFLGSAGDDDKLGLIQDDGLHNLKLVDNIKLPLILQPGADPESEVTIGGFTWEVVCRNTQLSMLGNCFNVASSLLEKKYCDKSKPKCIDKSKLKSNNDLDSLIAVVTCARNAFAHCPHDPKWYMPPPKSKSKSNYAQPWTVNYKNEKLIFDLTNKNGHKLVVSDFGGYLGIYKLFDKITDVLR